MSIFKDKSKIFSFLGRSFFIVAIIFLIVYMISIVTGSEAFLENSAERNALIDFDNDIKIAEEVVEVHYENLYEIVEKLQYAESEEEVKTVVKSYIGSEKFGNLRYFVRGKAYTADGALMEDEFVDNEEKLTKLSQMHKRGCTDIYNDSYSGYDCIAFFVPVRGSVYVDGILSVIPARNIIGLSDVLGERNAAVLLINDEGKVLASETRMDFEYSVGNSIYPFMSKLTTDKLEIKALEAAVKSGEKTACAITTIGTKYTAALSPMAAMDRNFTFVTLSESQGLLDTEMIYIRHIIILIFVALTALLIGMVYAFSYYRRMRVALDNASQNDPIVGCPNIGQFKHKLKGFALPDKKFAVCVYEIRQFRAIAENLDERQWAGLLKYIAKVIETFCGPKETYCYSGNGKFVLSIEYSDESSISDRAKLIEAMVNKHPILGKSKAKKKFNIGVAISTLDKDSIDAIIDNANIACSKAKTDVNIPYELFTDKIGEEREHTEQIEAEMENALAGGEFRLSLQPKYNVANDRVDSAEALVRWFDPKRGEYRFPGEFIGLFETNGFIKKLDHFMYIEVLKCLSTSASRGEKVVPISVNVSLLTVNSEDFLDFYISRKEDYGVADGFITIEFTESFAMQDYNKINKIISKLHENGINCSLDDFGTGYASLAALKNIAVDEVKLDRMFLREGVDKKNDGILLETIISLAKSLGMKVVQEGVETKEMFDATVAMDCDVIQGYYYAKAIDAEEYKLFLNSNTSIKFKSLVK